MIFDYTCPKCGRAAEVNVKRHDDTVWCNQCENVAMDKVPSFAGAVQVNGFSYKNGYSRQKDGS